MADWNHISDDTATYQDCPFGEIKHNWEWNKRDETADDAGEDVFEIRQNTSMTPGRNKYSDCADDYWNGEWQKAENLWNKSNFDNVSLYDSDPDGGGDTVGVSVGYAAATLNWSFNTGGEVDKHLDGDNVHWEVHEIYEEERTETQELEPGSVVIMDDTYCDQKRYFTKLNAEGHFQNSLSLERHYLSYYWDLYLTNYCQD